MELKKYLEDIHGEISCIKEIFAIGKFPALLKKYFKGLVLPCYEFKSSIFIAI